MLATDERERLETYACANGLQSSVLKTALTTFWEEFWLPLNGTSAEKYTDMVDAGIKTLAAAHGIDPQHIHNCLVLLSVVEPIPPEIKKKVKDALAQKSSA
jgi:hypothetical protein